MGFRGPTYVQLVDFAIQSGRGAVALVDGQNYSIYRLGPTVQNSLSSSRPIITGFQAKVKGKPKKGDIENDIFNLVAFTMSCNNLDLQLLDLAVQTGTYRNDGSVFYVAQIRPTKPTIWMRAEMTASISRPYPVAGAADQQPAAGPIAAPDGDWVGVWKEGEQILTLVDGQYAFSSAPDAVGATIYVGYQPRAPLKDGVQPKIPGVGVLPTVMYREHYAFYLPLLPGEQINELDRISLGSSDRYEVAILFSTELTGLAGTIAICEKLPT